MSIEDVMNHEKKHGSIPEGAAVFMYSGWDQYWFEHNRWAAMVAVFIDFQCSSARYMEEKQLGCCAGCQEISRCRTRGEPQGTRNTYASTKSK